MEVLVMKKRLLTFAGIVSVMTFALTLLSSSPAYSGPLADKVWIPKMALIMMMHDLSHRTDYCVKIREGRVGMVTPCRTWDSDGDDIQWIESISHDIPATVSPGEVVNATIDFDLGDVPGTPVIYNDIFADWAPDNRLAGINYTISSPTSKSMPFSFTAPRFPGKYRIRWMHSSTFRPVISFFGRYGGCYETNADPDYMDSPGAWMEVTIEVVVP